MTKTSVFLKEDECKKPKPIEFILFIDDDGKLNTETVDPEVWDNIQLISAGDTYDVMLAWDNKLNNIGNTCVYLGHWNDGVVK